MSKATAKRKESMSEIPWSVDSLFDFCDRFSLVPIPLKPGSKVPQVKWSEENWKPTPFELKAWASKLGGNWGIRCGQNLAVIDCDSEDAYQNFITTHKLPSNCPIVKTGRGYHIWLKPEKPIRSQHLDGVEVKCLGSYIVVPPSIHPSGTPYIFTVPLDGVLPEVDLEALFNLKGNITSEVGKNQVKLNPPSEFALHYGKSPYSDTLCGLATKIITSPDGQVKKLINLRCYRWHCPKCAPLQKRYWIEKLNTLPFRFIIKLPTINKPTTFLRHLGKPDYVHIVDNSSSWLFLTQGEAKKVLSEVQKAGYQLVASGITGDLTPQEIFEFLERALCREQESLNTRRKVSHSRGLCRRQRPNDRSNESKQTTNRSEEYIHMKKDENKEPYTWRTEVVMKPIEYVANQLQTEGWHIFWKSEVEAVAVKDKTLKSNSLDIVELMGNLGVKLKKTGKEYSGLCPFHDDHIPSLSVNREKGLWHCFGCGRGGNTDEFLNQWEEVENPMKLHKVKEK